MAKLLEQTVKDSMTGGFISGSEFEAGLTLVLVSMKPIPAEDLKYGAKEDGNGLKAGETWEYTFETEAGARKTFKNASSRLSGGVARLDPEAGAKLFFQRSGSGMDTQWEVKTV